MAAVHLEDQEVSLKEQQESMSPTSPTTTHLSVLEEYVGALLQTLYELSQHISNRGQQVPGQARRRSIWSREKVDQ